MPGLVGTISQQPQDNIGATLDGMAAAIRHYDWYQTERHVAPDHRFAIAHVHLGIMPTKQWLHGEESDGFTRVYFDAATQTLVIENDPFGMMPLFYAVIGSVLVFSTELKGVLAHPAIAPTLDATGLADLLSFGFCLGDHTLVAGIRCARGGTRLQFDTRTGRFTHERTWDFRQHIGGGSRRTFDGLVERFQHAVESRCASDQSIGVSLSGGYDSRTIFAAVHHAGRRAKTLTLDVPGGADQVVAERIAHATGRMDSHTLIANSDAFFAKWPQYVHEMVWLTDGMYYDEACVMMSTLDKYRELGIQVSLRGHGGELARMQWAYELRCNRHVLACTNQPQLIDVIFRQLRFGFTDDDLDRVFVPELRGLARVSLEQAFDGIDPSWHLIDQVSCVYVQEYLRRQSAPSLAELRSRIEIRLPFLDMEYVRAVLELAPDFRLGTGVHRHLLAGLSPALLRIVNSNTGAPAGAADWRQMLYARVNKQLKRWFGYQPYPHYVDVPAWLRGQLRTAMERILLDERTLDRGLYRPDGIRRLLAHHASGALDCGAHLLLLLYVELWHRLFVERDSWR